MFFAVLAFSGFREANLGGRARGPGQSHLIADTLRGLARRRVAVVDGVVQFAGVAAANTSWTRAQRAAYIDRKLAELYPDPAIPLNHSDPFTLLVAVMLSAHTTDRSVNSVTPELFRVAGTPEEMMRLPVEEIQRIIRPVGLSPTKAKNLSGMARLLVEKHGGQVPRTFEELEALPGVGHKTAGVVMVQAFGVPAFPVDTHIHRLAQRWGLSNGKSVEQTERDLKAAFRQERWNKLHLQFIYYGREHCTARGCGGMTCQICRAVYPDRKREKKTRAA
jgi:endonuclease-3